MCNHYAASGAWRTKMDVFRQGAIDLFDWTAPRSNVQGDNSYPAHVGEILKPDGERLAAASATWLYIPVTEKGTWANWMKTRRGCNNARGEEADGKWPFRFAAKSGRCLIPGEAFFEWDDGPKGGKTEYRFAYPDGRAFFFAGLCGSASPADVGEILTYTMVTKAAGGDTASIGHKRQPVVLAPDQVRAWLDGENTVAGFTEATDPPWTFSVLAVKGPKAGAALTPRPDLDGQ